MNLYVENMLLFIKKETMSCILIVKMQNKRTGV